MIFQNDMGRYINTIFRLEQLESGIIAHEQKMTRMLKIYQTNQFFYNKTVKWFCKHLTTFFTHSFTVDTLSNKKIIS